MHEQISLYLGTQGNRCISLTDYDLKKMATDGSSSSIVKACFGISLMAAMTANDSTQFLKLVLLVAISPPNNEIISKIPSLPLDTQKVLQALIQEIAPSRPPSEDGDGPETSDVDSERAMSREAVPFPPTRRKDRELVLEEELAQVKARLTRNEAVTEDLMAEKEDLSSAYVRLQEQHEAIKQSSAENEDRLKKLTSIHNERELWSIRDLEAKISQQEETIGRQESQIAELQTTEAELQRKASKFVSVEEQLQKLLDEFHIQKVNLDEQTKKANAGDKYKLKVQASQGIERERDALRNQIEELRPRSQAYDEVRRENTKLKQENHEIGQTLSHSERSNNELREMKQAYVAEIDRLRRETNGLREALAEGQERIVDLEDRSGGSGIHPPTTVVDGGLETELAETSKHEQQMQVAKCVLFWTRILTMDRKSRIVELEKQNRKIADDAEEKDVAIVTLQRQCEKVQALSADLGEQLQWRSQEIFGLQSSLAEVRQGHPIEGSVAPFSRSIAFAHNTQSTETFKRMREQLKSEQETNIELEEKLSAAQKDIEAANHERMSSFDRHCLISELNIDLLQGALVDKPKLEMVEEVRKQNSLALLKLQAEHGALQTLHRRIQDENFRLKDERNHAWYEAHEAVVAKGQADSDHAANNQGLADLKDMIEKYSTDRSAESNTRISEALERNFGVFAEKIEEGRARIVKQQQVAKMFSCSTSSAQNSYFLSSVLHLNLLHRQATNSLQEDF